MKSIYFSRFMPTCQLGGGSRRLMQMLETLGDLDCRLVTSARGDELTGEQLARIKEETVQISRGKKQLDQSHRYWSQERRQVAHRLAEISRQWSYNIPDLSDLDLVIMDDPIYFTPLLEKLIKLDIPVAAVCHNLETTAPLQVDSKYPQEALARELGILSRCKLVITISREESLVLTNHDIPNYFFPYYPPLPILNRLNRVRQKRKRWKWRKKRGILMVGSAMNPQTREGMEIVAKKWENPAYFQHAIELLVAGYNSEKLFKPQQMGPGAKFLGSLNDKELDKLLCQAKASLCYQEAGAGALTRICESLLAGLPVLANNHAARSYHNAPGLIEFSQFPEPDQITWMIASLEQGFPAPKPPDIPALLTKITRSMTIHA